MKVFNGLRSRTLMMVAAVILGLSGVAGQVVAKTTYNSGTIVSGTDEKTVVSYLRQNHRLPDNYITKKKRGKRAGMHVPVIFATCCQEKPLAVTVSRTGKGVYRQRTNGSGVKRISTIAADVAALTACCLPATG